jgi:hypothetical protein
MIAKPHSTDRGQTLHDYFLGVSLFLLTVFFVAGTILPTLLAPFETEAGGDKIAQTERVAETIIQNTSRVGEPNELNLSNIQEIAGKDTDELRTRFGLPTTRFINISIWTLDGSTLVADDSGTTLRAGSSATANNAASTARIVNLDITECDGGCRLLVQVW